MSCGRRTGAHGLSRCSKGSSFSKNTHLIGCALDGFGIYRVQLQGQMLSTGDLDACHGRTSLINWEGKMARMHHDDATLDFPSLIGCYKGTPITSATGLAIGCPQGGGGAGPPAGP